MVRGRLISNYRKFVFVKKVSLMFAFAVLLFFILWTSTTVQAAVADVDFIITNYHIDAYVGSDGSMSVQELLVYDGSFNGQYWNLEYATGGEKTTNTVDIADLQGNASIYNAHGITDIKVFALKDPDGGLGEENLVAYSRLWNFTGNLGDTGVYEQGENTGSVSLKIYALTESSRKALLITYRLEDVAVMHQDVAEIYWDFIGRGWVESLHDVSVNIYLPTASEELHIFGHGALDGVSKIVSNRQVRLSINAMNPGEVLDGRVIFSKDVLDSCLKTTTFTALPEILDIEAQKTKEANIHRILNRILRILIIALSVLGLLGMPLLTYYLYSKYNKGKKADFQGKYYRELPGDYGPAIMSYNVNNKLVSAKDLTASILNMIHKKILILSIQKVEKDRVLLGTKATEEYTIQDNSQIFSGELSSNEEFIRHWLIEKIGNGTSVTFEEIKKYSKDKKKGEEFFQDFGLWMGMVRREAEKQDFFQTNVDKGIALGIYLGILAIGLGVIAIFYGYWVGYANIPIGIAEIVYAIRLNRRTKKGNEDYAKWKAFSNYLKDFGKLEDAKVPSVVIWEKYLVYAVSLGIADKVLDSMQLVLKSSDFTYGGLTFVRSFFLYGGVGAVHAMNASFSGLIKSALNLSTGKGVVGGFGAVGGGGGGGGTGGGGF